MDLKKTQSFKALASLKSVTMDKGKGTRMLRAGPRVAFSTALSWVERMGQRKKVWRKEKIHTYLCLGWALCLPIGSFSRHIVLT